MKKVLFILALLLFIIPVAVFCQTEVPVPEGWGDVLLNYQVYFASLGGVAVLVAFITAFVTGLLKVENKFLKQLAAWLVGIIALVGADLLNFGYVAEFPIWFALLNGLAAGFISNGVFDVPFFKTLLDKIDQFFRKTATS